MEQDALLGNVDTMLANRKDQRSGFREVSYGDYSKRQEDPHKESEKTG